MDNVRKFLNKLSGNEDITIHGMKLDAKDRRLLKESIEKVLKEIDQKQAKEKSRNSSIFF